MSDSWLDYLQIVQHPHLDRFENGGAVETMYEEAVSGLSPLYYGRPEGWYGRAKNTSHAIERLGEMVLARHDAYEHPDWMKVLEEAEDRQSVDLIERIFNHYKEERHQARKPTGTGYQAYASEKQRALLRKLGVVNFSGTKQEASAMIEKLKTW